MSRLSEEFLFLVFCGAVAPVIIFLVSGASRGNVDAASG
jgi:hypothetical protein